LTARRPVLAVVLVSVAALVWAGGATAASPQRIYKDLADNGRLDGRYNRADIARALNLQQVVKTDRSLAPVRRPAAAAPKAAVDRKSVRRVPFTGLDLALLTVGGGPLLLIGIGLRRRLAPAARSPEIVGS
jgi:hypothetical protein